MGFGSLLRRIAPPGRLSRAESRGRADDENVEALRAAFDTLRRDLRSLRKELAHAHRQIGRTHQRVEQLLALRREDEHAGEWLDRLAPTMDFNAGARHAREAIERARRVDEPVPHLLIAPLLPAGIYRALLEAIPPRVFFARGRSGFDELRIPPDLAPLHVVASWKFFARLVRRVITPALVGVFTDRLGERLDGRPASEGYLVRREAGAGDGLAPRSGVWRLVLHLEPEGDEHANTAVAFVDVAGAHACLPLPADAPERDVRYRYELAIMAGKTARSDDPAGV